MSVGIVQRTDECKYSGFENEPQCEKYDAAKDLLLESTATFWKVERSDLDSIIECIYGIQDKVQGKIESLKSLELEEVSILRSMRQLQKLREKAVQAVNPEKIESARARLRELTSQLQALESTLETAKSDMISASDAYEAAVRLKRDPTKSSKTKTRLNREWLGIQQARPRTEKVHQRALEMRDAAKQSVDEQAAQVKLLGDGTTKIDADIEIFKERLLANKGRWAEINVEIDDLSNTASIHIDVFVTTYVAVELQQQARTSLRKLKRSCIGE